MLDRIKALVKNKDMAVLATSSESRPHCSLMAYLCNDACTEIYMVTYRNTQKFKNLSKNPHVSLLIDTRDEGPAQGRRHIQALTIDGRYEAITEHKKAEAIRQQMMARHPHLQPIIQHAECEIIAIRIASFLWLDGPVDAHFETA